MVSADSLNLDVLELIFAYLSRRDLLSVALVSRSFLSAVIPKLYHTLSFRLRHAKQYPKVMTPFSAVVAHPELAVHVRKIDIRITPTQDISSFTRECTRAVDLCHNLNSFLYTWTSPLSYLPVLQEKHRLQDLRIYAKLTTDQAEMLLKLKKIQTLTLDFGSWNTMDALPRWASSIQKTLTSLTLYMSSELNEGVLETTLAQLPQLLGFHVIGCPKVDHVAVLRLVSYTPLLESLAFTTTDTSSPLPLPAPALHHLRSLALDTRSGPSPVLPVILTYMKATSPQLSSFAIKAPKLTAVFEHLFVKQLLDTHAPSLKKLLFYNCEVEIESITAICKACIRLEQLNVPLPIKNLVSFTEAISHSHTLHTVVDANAHITHGSLTQENTRFMMRNTRNLKKIVSGGRIWTGRRINNNNDILVSFERQAMRGGGTHWFISRV